MAGSILPLLGLYDRIYFMIVIFFRISITIRWSLGGIRLLHLVYADDPVGDINQVDLNNLKKLISAPKSWF